MERYKLAWKHDDCGETYEFESSERYTEEAALARAEELCSGGSYDVELHRAEG